MGRHKIAQFGRYFFIRPFLDEKISKQLSDHCSYERSNSEFIPNPAWRYVHLYNPKKGCFPIGLWSHVKQKLDQCGVDYELVDEKREALLHPFNPSIDMGLRPYQVKAISELIKNKGGILEMPTGSGKTRTAIAYIKYLNVKTLILVPTLELKKQWKERVGDHADISTYAGVKLKSKLMQYKLIIFDECHHVAAKTIYKIGMNISESSLTVGLSATPYMRDNDNMKVEAVLGKIVFKITTRELIDQGYLCDAVIHYHPIQRYDSVVNDYTMTYREYIISNEERNRKILDLACQSKGYVLILVSIIEHGEILLEQLVKMKEDVVFLNGSTKKEQREDNIHRIIIATSIYDEGVDLPHLNVLILAAGGKSAIKIIQRVGRLLRNHNGKDKAIIHDFKDDTKWLSSHYRERRAILEKDFEVIDDDR